VVNGGLLKLRGMLVEERLDAFLVSTPESRRYLSGFTGSAGYLFITGDVAVLATDFRYVEQGMQQSPGFEIRRISSGLDWFYDLVRETGVGRIGVESHDMTVAMYKSLINGLRQSVPDHDVMLVETSNTVELIRALKEPEEIALIARAVELADAAFEEVAPTIRVGMTEREVGWRMEKAMREHGADAQSFDIIVASGPNAALPHHRPSDRSIGDGEPVVVDMGAIYRGYCSDMTRTLCLGVPDDTFRKVYDIVLGAQLTAIATVQAGMTGGVADAIARDIITDAGYGANFGHSLGHGIGLAVHEYPTVGPNAEALLQNGMVFTIEPGIYLTGWGGVRIEDTVVMENGLVRSLNRAHKLEDPRGA
jgi:Xaa-Pro aminopeptidase